MKTIAEEVISMYRDNKFTEEELIADLTMMLSGAISVHRKLKAGESVTTNVAVGPFETSIIAKEI